MSVPCKIVLVDDHTLFRNGLRTLLGGIEGFEVVAEASNGLELLELLERSLPDVVLLDIEMPKMNGIAAAEEALRRWPGLKIITLSMYGDEDYYFRMVSLGVKGIHPEKLSISRMSWPPSRPSSREGASSRRETSCRSGQQPEVGAFGRSGRQCRAAVAAQKSEILLHICRGESNNEIADALFISKRTVDKHRSNALAKTGCKNTANLVVYAIKNNLVEI